MKSLFACLIALFFLQGCASMMAERHAQDVTAGQGEKLTLGKVQSQIRKGMTSGQVAEVMGSPNIVSTDENGHEVWVYDKVSSLSVVSGSQGGSTYGLAGAASTSQRTLTVIIKFDGAHRVKSTAYNASSF